MKNAFHIHRMTLNHPMNYRKIIGTFFLIFVFQSAHAQIFDTIRESFHTKPKLLLQLDAYNSFVSKEPANTFGYRAGLEFNKRVRIGIGYYKLTSDIVKSRPVPGVVMKDSMANAQLDMFFIPVFFEYVFYNKDPWEISVPVNLGVGKSYFWYYKKQPEGEKGKVDQKAVALITISAAGQYKILPWFGVGAGLGFRLMLKDNSNINENFNSVIYSLGLRVFVDEIFKSMFPAKSENKK